MLEKLKNALSNAQHHGTQTVLNSLKEERYDISKIEHLINVFEFCDLLEILTEHLIQEKFNFYVYFRVVDMGSTKIIRNVIYMGEEIVSETSTSHHGINSSFQKLSFGINQMISKFTNIDISFINSKFIDNPIKIRLPLNESGKQQIAENFLNKEMFVAYQQVTLENLLSKSKGDEGKGVVKI